MAKSSPPLHGSRLYLALFYMLCMGLVWGLQFSMAKIAMQGGIHPLGFTLATSISGAVILLAVARLRGAAIPLRRDYLVYALVAGATAISIPNSIAALVVSHVPAGLAAVLNTLSPVITYAMAWAIGMEKRHTRKTVCPRHFEVQQDEGQVICGFVIQGQPQHTNTHHPYKCLIISKSFSNMWHNVVSQPTSVDFACQSLLQLVLYWSTKSKNRCAECISIEVFWIYIYLVNNLTALLGHPSATVVNLISSCSSPLSLSRSHLAVAV
jgi:hypothetical protein